MFLLLVLCSCTSFRVTTTKASDNQIKVSITTNNPKNTDVQTDLNVELNK